jgi:hypothetical protein
VGEHGRLHPLRWRDLLLRRLYTRRCRDFNCLVDFPHSHHLTRLGRWHYVGRYE